MSFADNLRQQLADTDQQIIDTKFMPRRDEILQRIAEGIKRLGYVCIDTSSCGTSTPEGRLGVNQKELSAFKKFITQEGFKASFSWWGYSTDGLPDMLTIRL